MDDDDGRTTRIASVVVDEVRTPPRPRRKSHWSDDQLPREMTDGPPPPHATRPPRWPGLVAIGGLLLALGNLGYAYWTHSQGQTEILRLSTELAQLRVSLDLYARNGADGPGLSDLDQRLSAIEQSALSNAVPMPTAPVAAPELESTTPQAADQEDCLPEGMRLLVASGDTYPICGQLAEVAVSAVANGYITLADGTSIASGGTTPLPGLPACTIAVTSGGDEGVTGYAEIRVTC